ncbi:hypothetical protein K8R62_01570 [bacterium]|nr:hypothetical protein [bacterium]
MINKNFIKKLKKDYIASNSERRQIISLSNIILHDSKRIIFTLHRGDMKKAEDMFVSVENILKKLEKKFSFKRISDEGSYRAGVEEYVEAKMFYFLMMGKKIDSIKGIKINYDSYIGGICDCLGELVRLAVNKASNRELEDVVKLKNTVNNVMAELVEFDMTGYLRTKYDQARGHLRKIEQINYDVNIRK